MIRLIALVVLLLANTATFFVVVPALAGGHKPRVGGVKHLSASPDNYRYRLERIEEGQKVVHGVGPSTILHEDDVLWIECGGDKRSITIQSDNEVPAEKSVRKITCQKSPYVVPGESARIRAPFRSEAAVKGRVLVGYVKHLSAPSDCYMLVRKTDGHKVSQRVDIFTLLYEGDVIRVACSHKCSSVTGNDKMGKIDITLQLADSEKVLKCSDEEFVLPKRKPHSVMRGILVALGDVLERYWPFGLHDDYYHAKLVSLAVRGRGSRLFMPLVGCSGSRLVEGARNLRLAWCGGIPPYVLRIRAATLSKPITELSGLEKPRTRIEGLKLELGGYDIEVADAQHRFFTRRLEVVPRAALPTPPAEALRGARDGPDRLLSETIYAAWLSEQDDGVWMLEAYQRVADIASQYYPAALLQVQLEGEI